MGAASKWFYNSYSSFTALLESFDLTYHVQKSEAAKNGPVDVSSPTRPCQEPTFTTLAFLMVASRLGFGGYKEQGLRDGASRKCCELVLKSLLDALKGTTFMVPVEFDFGWQHITPRPRKRCAPYHVELVVNSAGKIDLQPWKLLATDLEQQDEQNECVRWWLLIQDVVDEHGLSPSFTDLYMFEKLCLTEPLGRFWFQLSVAAASALDTTIMNLEEQSPLCFIRNEAYGCLALVMKHLVF